MKNNKLTYFNLIIIHVIIGLVIYLLPFLAKLYTVFVFAFGVIYMFRTKNKNNEALLISGYIVGVEVFLRMTEGNPVHELSKYLVMFFLVFGMFYKGFSKNSYIYVVFLLLLIPGIIIGANELSFDTNVRKAIAFNISGPVCLAVAAIYCYQRVVSKEQIYKLLVFIGLPILSMTIYLFLYTPTNKEIFISTQSNFSASGGFGPNQVSTSLGLGMFAFFTLALLYSNTKRLVLLNLIVFVIVSYRGILTFSRGGVITGIAMIVFLILVLYYYSSPKIKSKLLMIVLFSIIGAGFLWTYSVYKTNGMIEYRYANKDARGREKEDKLGGRELIAETELDAFKENPIFGIGVGKNAEYREEIIGHKVSSHNEITRMLADHGSFGLFGLIILFVTPLFLYLDNKQNIFLLSFFVFWALTINHAAMRTAAPSFIYALSLLKVKFIDEE
ncbi:O-antigen ligase family protein [Flavobacterium sp.]|uniref:O-antigen ligase family protein n=1 Tax=Flavobacterium sp. TaxID=239 RepID=UPI002FDE3D41